MHVLHPFCPGCSYSRWLECRAHHLHLLGGYSWVQNDRLLRAVVAFVFGLPLFTSGAVAGTRDLPYWDIVYYPMSMFWSESEYSVWKLSSSIDYQMMLMDCTKRCQVQREDTWVYTIEMEQMRRQDWAQKRVGTGGLELMYSPLASFGT